MKGKGLRRTADADVLGSEGAGNRPDHNDWRLNLMYTEGQM